MTGLPEAQRVIQTLLNRTNLLMAGKRVAITADAPGLAERLRAMGAHPGADLARADLVIGAPVDLALLKPGAILALENPPQAGSRVRDGITAHLTPAGHEVFVLDLSC